MEKIEIPADGGDRYRTAAARIQWREFSAGVNLFTGDPGLRSEDRRVVNGTYVENRLGDDPNKYRAGIAYISYGNYRIGRDSEKIRHWAQNRFAHDFLTGSLPNFLLGWLPNFRAIPSPHFEVLGLKPSGYFSVGRRNPYTLW
ncbi:MAG: polymorphic toxin type 23 domain-containing protein [Bacteroidales bacterium]|nr:polymorphic toxin type 23 domain-containing protein [Bacteroidales bacterium]